MRRRGLRACAVILGTSLVSTLVAQLPQASADVTPKNAQQLTSVPGKAIPVKPPAKSTTPEAHGTPKVTWPAPATADVAIAEARATAANPARAGALPVLVGGIDPKSDPGKVQVQVLGRDEAKGLMVKVTRADGAKNAAPVSLSVDYDGFRNAYGGDWASRLRLVPQGSAAPAKTIRNDLAAGRLVSEVPASPDGAVYSLQADSGGAGGDYKATSLSPSAEWKVSEQTGSFAWTYPMRVPPVPGDLVPGVKAAYNSGSVDGRVPTANNQTSWLGEGWDLSAGFIERRYKACADDLDGNQGKTKTGDMCWGTDNATISFDGHSGQLVKADDSGQNWRLRNDDGSRIQRMDGADNGDDNGEFWRLTTTDGTQYTFGLHKVPGRPDTNSTWTVPVAGNNTGEPCNKTTFDASFCSQAYRWNLDYVVDTHGNTMVYTYETFGNKYGRNLAKSTADYIRAGALQQIDYGTRAGSDGPAAARVVFTTAERCAPGADCSAKVKESYPDVPWDRDCAGPTCPEKFSPTFWTTKRLANVTTQVRDGNGYRDVERWTFDQTFPDPGDRTSPALWLAGINHAGLAGTEAAMPPVTFVLDPKHKANRINTNGDGLPAGNKHRIGWINTETGGRIDVNYADATCKPGTMPQPDTNTDRCYPVRWAMTDAGPVDDWFHKYVVASVGLVDRVGGAPTQFTNYDYEGGAAWAYRDDPLVDEKFRTWSEWRGYGKVRVRKGDPADLGNPVQSSTRNEYFRGMNGDKLNNGGTKQIKVGGIDDDRQYNGFLREQILQNGVDGAEVGGTVNVPTSLGPTAESGPDKAYIVRTADELDRTALEGGGFRRTEKHTTYDEFGFPKQVNDLGDVSTPEDDQCVTTEYARNLDSWLLKLPRSEEKNGAACTATPSFPRDAITNTRSFYDNHEPWNATPTAGNLTKVDELKAHNGTPEFRTSVRNSFDDYGRITESYDALGHKTETQYVPKTGLVTATTEINALGHRKTTTLDPAWNLPTAVVNPDDTRVDTVYDGLGRIVKVWGPGRKKADNVGATVKFDYGIKNDGASFVKTQSLKANGNYVASYSVFDGFLRPRQTQDPSPQGGRKLNDTFYDNRGLVAKTNAAYYNAGTEPNGVLLDPDDTLIPNQTVNVYDGAERKTKQTYEKNNTPQWATTTVYSGDHVTVTPPAGESPNATYTDARGQVTEIRQFNGAVTGPYNSTKKSYTKAGELAKTVDAVNNVWTSTFDVAGDKIANTDPDKGAATLTYDDAGNVVSTKDARGQVTVNVYDLIGRRTELRKDSPTGELLAKWTYDTQKKGKLSSSTRYSGGKEYVSTTTYDDAGRPQDNSVSIPTGEKGLTGTYTTSNTFAYDGSLKTVSLPRLGDVPAETINYEYDSLGLLTKTTGAATYVGGTKYTALGEVTQLQLGAEGKRVWQTVYYEEGTRRVANSLVERETSSTVKTDETSYAYDPSGNVKQIDNTTAGSALDRQCMTYDGLRRLTEAWTTTAGCAAPGAASGGPAPYWNTYRPDAVGRRLSQTQHAVAGAPETTTTMTYPDAGKAQPHAPATISVAGAMRAASANGAYEYDRTGNTLKRPSGAGDQTYTWDAEGQLAAVTSAGKTTSYINTPENGRLVAAQDTTSTLYLPGGELKVDKNTGAATGTRYYLHAGRVVAARNAAGASYLMGDKQGTTTLAIDSSSLQPVKRRFDPFGVARAAAPASWPASLGYVGGTSDSATGLTRLGVRDYDPNTGKFVAVDPVLDSTNPQHLDAYSYSYNNPTTFSDPTGTSAYSDEQREMLALKIRSQGRPESADRLLGIVNAGTKKNTPSNTAGEMWKGRKGATVGAHNAADVARELAAWRREQERKAAAVAREIEKQTNRKLADEQLRKILDSVVGFKSVSICGSGSAGALLALGLEVCVNADDTGIALSGGARFGVEGGIGVAADLMVRINTSAADHVGHGLFVSGEAGLDVHALGGASVKASGGMYVADDHHGNKAGTYTETGVQASVGVGAKVSVGGLYFNVGGNSGYIMKWDGSATSAAQEEINPGQMFPY